MRTSKKIIVLNYLAEKNHSEIDIELLEDQFPGYSDDDSEDSYPLLFRKNDKKMSYSGEQDPIKISHVEDIIKTFKAKGCTHIEIMHHGDHNGYYFYGIDIHNASKKETTEINKTISNSEIVYLGQRKEQLEKEIKLIDKRLADGKQA